MGWPLSESVMTSCVRYAATSDHVNLAWTESGHGLPLVKVATWLTHLQYDAESPIWSHWVRFLGARFRYVRYDERGCGLSDRVVPEPTLTRWVEDLECVVDAAGIDRPFALLGVSQGAAAAILYTLRHPERVSHLILYGGYAVGANKSTEPGRAEMYRTVRQVVALGWGSHNPAFRQVFTSRFIPQATTTQIEWFNELCRQTASAETASALLAARGEIDVRSALPLVRTPTLVLHCSDDQIAPISQGRLLASQIPGARFVQLESGNHVLLEHEPAWEMFKREILEFTGHCAADGEMQGALLSNLTPRERMVMRLLCDGLSNAQIGWRLGVAEKTARNHVSNLYRKIGVRSRAEAIVLAYRNDLVPDAEPAD